MHSQQAKVPYSMIPIGGIQIVQARPRSHATTPTSPTSPPMEGPSLARFETYWGGTPRTQGLRTPGDHWSEHQTAGTSQSGQQGLSTALTFSKPELEATDSKQYGSSHSSVHTHGSSTETTEHCASDDRSRAPPSLTPPVASSVIGQQPEREERTSGSDMVAGGAKGDSATRDQRTWQRLHFDASCIPFCFIVCYTSLFCLFVCFFVIALGFIYIFNTIVHLNVCFGNIQVCYKDALFSLWKQCLCIYICVYMYMCIYTYIYGNNVNTTLFPKEAGTLWHFVKCTVK